MKSEFFHGKPIAGVADPELFVFSAVLHMLDDSVIHENLPVDLREALAYLVTVCDDFLESHIRTDGRDLSDYFLVWTMEED